MIKNIIFDLAGVVMNLNLERDTAALNAAGLPDFAGCLANEEIRKPCLAYLNGLMPKREFFEAIRPMCKEGVTDAEIDWAMNAVCDDIPKERIEMLIGLRKQYKVYLLSNIYDDAWAHATNEIERQGYTLEQCFDQLFLSHKMQLAKPDARIFNAVVEATGIKPEETLFFDDTKENVEAAKKLGFSAHLVKMNCLESCLNQFVNI